MAKGEECPHCSVQTFHKEGSFRRCSSCGAIGWSWQHGVTETGKGKGNKCPNCDNQTLHEIVKLSGGEAVRRCGTCDYSLIEPPDNV